MRIVIIGAGIGGLAADAAPIVLLADERAPAGFADIHDVIPADELTEIAAGYKRAAGFHPDVLNARTSLTPTLSASR